KMHISQAAEAAANAAFAILNELDDFNENYFKPYFNLHFNVGIGLHTGKVIVGNIGLGIHNNLTVMGLPVNIASRLQNATKQLNNSFIISDEAYKHLTNAPKNAQRQSVTLKG